MAATKMPAFVVDKKGLAKLLERKGKAFAVVELIQNAWDEDTSRVDVTLELIGKAESKGCATYRLVVEDDNPEGFKDLTHAYTLFAESEKKDKADKRGRFNLGEKLVIAICDSASIATTKGTIVFTGETRQHFPHKTRESGSRFTGVLALNALEAMEVQRVVTTLLPPEGICTTFNMVEVEPRKPLRTFEVTLKTELGDADGRLKPTARKTQVEIYEPADGEQPSIYEMGIPIVDTGDRWHVNICQKVPLSSDRDNVPPAYLRDVRCALLNECWSLLTESESKASWVTNAMEHPKVDAKAVEGIFKQRFGEKTVIFDPNDHEANKMAAAEGYVVVPGGSLPKGAWAHVKAGGIALPAGQVTGSGGTGGTVHEVKVMDPAHYPGYVENVVDFARFLAFRLMGADVSVAVTSDPQWPAHADYCSREGGSAGELRLNLGRLGHKWFEQVGAHTIDLLIHEFGHHYSDDHLDRAYYKALSKLGAGATMLALEHRDEFEKFGFTTAP